MALLAPLVGLLVQIQQFRLVASLLVDDCPMDFRDLLLGLLVHCQQFRLVASLLLLHFRLVASLPLLYFRLVASLLLLQFRLVASLPAQVSLQGNAPQPQEQAPKPAENPRH